MLHGGKQEGAEASALLVGLGKPIAREQPGKKFLGQILSIMGGAAPSAGIGVKWIPIRLARWDKASRALVVSP